MFRSLPDVNMRLTRQGLRAHLTGSHIQFFYLILRSKTLMQRNASAHWSGGLKDGKGTLTSPSGVLKNTPYSFATRFESQPGTNPEELIAAAHAGCFSMALSAQLATP